MQKQCINFGFLQLNKILIVKMKMRITLQLQARQFYQMQSQTEVQSPLAIKKRQLLTISSINKNSIDKKPRYYKTLDANHKLAVETYTHNKDTINSEMLATKIINVELSSELFDSPAKRYKESNSNKKILNQSTGRSKGKGSQDKTRDFYRKEKGTSKYLIKYKFPLSDQKTPMKRYIKIQRIELPNPISAKKSSSFRAGAIDRTEINNKYNKTIDEYNNSIVKKGKKQIGSSISKVKMHRRNYSSVINSRKSISVIEDQTAVIEKQCKKACVDDFQIRRPLGRKQYFVFGMSDRTNPQNKVQYYRDFLWKVNYSNSLHVHTPDQISNPYKAYIGPGNNYHLVKGILKRRFWWTIVDKPDNQQGWDSLNFLWTQLKQNHFFGFQQKGKLQFPNQQCGDSEMDVIKKSDSFIGQSPTANSSSEDFHRKLFSKTDLFHWNKHTLRNEKTQQKINELTYVKRLNLFYNKNMTNIQNSSKLKMHNHLESNFFIGNKKALFYNMRRYLNLKNVDPFTILPLTFHVTKGTQDPQFKTFKKYYEQIQANKNTNGLKNMWIVKPGQNTNRGNGISVAYSLDDIIVRLKGREKNSDGKFRTFIIQKYIQKPLLYCKRKFDIRHYMLISCVNGIFKGYWYEEGYIRTSSSQFTTKYSKDPFVHLTNDAIQKNGANYGRFEKGNKLSYMQFQKYIQNNYKHKKINFFEHILPQMKEIAAESVRATYAILDENRRQHNFELLGMDFMIDQDFKPWLIQINTNPCLQLSCSLLEKIIPQVVDNVFRVCVDPLFPPPQCWQSGKKLYFGQSPLSENKFQIIFDELDDGREIEKLYKDGNKYDERMGKIEQDDEVFEDDGDENWQNKK